MCLPMVTHPKNSLLARATRFAKHSSPRRRGGTEGRGLRGVGRGIGDGRIASCHPVDSTVERRPHRPQRRSRLAPAIELHRHAAWRVASLSPGRSPGSAFRKRRGAVGAVHRSHRDRRHRHLPRRRQRASAPGGWIQPGIRRVRRPACGQSQRSRRTATSPPWSMSPASPGSLCAPRHDFRSIESRSSSESRIR